MRSRTAALLSLLFFTFSTSCASAPGVIRDEMAITEKTKPGAATLVFFTDFQCPYCRKTHAALAPLLDDPTRHDRIRLVLRHVPLPRHPDAATAARAAVCVERLGPMVLKDYAHALMTSQDLSEAACEELAVERGIDRTLYQRCLADPSTDGRIRRDIQAYRAADGDGVPLIYVGTRRLDGAQTGPALAAALDEELGAR